MCIRDSGKLVSAIAEKERKYQSLVFELKFVYKLREVGITPVVVVSSYGLASKDWQKLRRNGNHTNGIYVPFRKQRYWAL